MKKYLPVFFVFLFFVKSNAQHFNYPEQKLDTTKVLVQYIMTYQPDSTDSGTLSEKEMLLFIGENMSYFLSREAYRFDTIVSKMRSFNEFQEFMMQPNKPVPRFNFKFYKNYPEWRITCLDHFLDAYKYEEKLPAMDWKLCNETDSVSGYAVQKAVCSYGGRNWEAWFAKEIPFSDGPYKFSGLPGLILKIRDTQGHYSFDYQVMYRPDRILPIVFVEKDYLETNRKSYLKAMEYTRQDIINRAKEAGIGAKGQQAAAKNMRRRNNPLELQ